MTKPTLLYYETLNYHSSILAWMKEHFNLISLFDPSQDTDGILQKIEVLLAPLEYAVDRGKIDRCPRLKIIASSTLSVPHINKRYADSQGIRVIWLSEDQKDFLNTITPTAELTWGLIIAITRKIPWAYKDVCNGKLEGRLFGKQTPRMLSNMTLGIIGLGRLGSLVASYGKAFGMEIYYYSPTSGNDKYTRCDTLLELASVSDIVSIHAHHLPATENLVSREFLNKMKPGSYLVNTARGAIVDELALLESLESGIIAGAALDVLSDEFKPGFQERLKNLPIVQYARSHDNLIITPHYAGATIDAWMRTQKKTIEIVLDTMYKIN